MCLNLCKWFSTTWKLYTDPTSLPIELNDLIPISCMLQNVYAGLAQWVYARLISERPQMQVQSLLEALLRSLKQAPIDGKCLP